MTFLENTKMRWHLDKQSHMTTGKFFKQLTKDYQFLPSVACRIIRITLSDNYIRQTRYFQERKQKLLFLI